MDDQQHPFSQQFWRLLSKKISQEATPVELQELESLFLAHPEWQHQADLLIEMWQQQAVLRHHDAEAAYMRHLMKYKDDLFVGETHENEPFIKNESARKEKHLSIRSFFSRRLTVVSFITLTIVAAGMIYFLSVKNKPVSDIRQEISSVATKNGNRTKIVLPDGSQVWLNAGSNLDYNHSTFNKEQREVTLNGEAYFDVVKNTTRPFIIHTKKMDIKVVGTSFNVRSYNDEKTAEASLITGIIEVTLKERKNQKIILKPHEKISIATEEEKAGFKEQEKLKNGSAHIPQIVVKELKPNPVDNIIPEIAWTQNRLYFEDASLEDIASMLEKWFGKNVQVQNESLKKIRYTGNFENETIETVLAYLKLSNAFDFRIGNDTVLIY